jgi:hypothetical protein
MNADPGEIGEAGRKNLSGELLAGLERDDIVEQPGKKDDPRGRQQGQCETETASHQVRILRGQQEQYPEGSQICDGERDAAGPRHFAFMEFAVTVGEINDAEVQQNLANARRNRKTSQE